MRKSLTYKILAAVLAAGSLGLYAAAPAAAEDNFNAPEDGTIVNGKFDDVYGNGTPITITGGTVTGNVYSGYVTMGRAKDNTVNISAGTVTGNVYGYIYIYI